MRAGGECLILNRAVGEGFVSEMTSDSQKETKTCRDEGLSSEDLGGEHGRLGSGLI